MEHHRTRYCCNATLAASVKGGVYRFFVPAGSAWRDDLSRLGGFVGDTLDVLTAELTPAAAQAGGIIFHPRVIVDRDDATCTVSAEPILRGLSDADVIAELHTTDAERARVAERLQDAAFLRAHGLCARATRAAWPYRIALCRAVAMATRRAVRYAELRDVDGGSTVCLSRTSVSFDVDGGVATDCTTARDGTCLMWDGGQWALRVDADNR